MDIAERHRLSIDRWFYPCSHTMHRGWPRCTRSTIGSGRASTGIGQGLTSFLAEASAQMQHAISTQVTRRRRGRQLKYRPTTMKRAVAVRPTPEHTYSLGQAVLVILSSPAQVRRFTCALPVRRTSWRLATDGGAHATWGMFVLAQSAHLPRLVGQPPMAAQWPRFRGPNGSGVSETDKPPTTFGPSSNRLWQAPSHPATLHPRYGPITSS